MKTQVSIATLKVTNGGSQLDMLGVRSYYDLFKKNEEVQPIIIVMAPNGFNYIVSGHHPAYGAYLAQRKDIDAILLSNDADVQTSTSERARKHKTLQELLVHCERGNGSSREVGIDTLSDYALRHPKPRGWDSH